MRCAPRVHHTKTRKSVEHEETISDGHQLVNEKSGLVNEESKTVSHPEQLSVVEPNHSSNDELFPKTGPVKVRTVVKKKRLKRDDSTYRSYNLFKMNCAINALSKQRVPRSTSIVQSQVLAHEKALKRYVQEHPFRNFSPSLISEDLCMVLPPSNKLIYLRETLKHVTIGALGSVYDIVTEFIQGSAKKFWTTAEIRCITVAANSSTMDYYGIEESAVFAMACMCICICIVVIYCFKIEKKHVDFYF